MNEDNKKKLEKAGWTVGSVDDLLGITTEEKSVVLAKLMGWPVRSQDGLIFHPDYDTGSYAFRDFYEPAYMSVAWQVLNWAAGQEMDTGYGPYSWVDYVLDATCPNGQELFEMAPAEAQTAWLDEILFLAIKAGMVKDE